MPIALHIELAVLLGATSRKGGRRGRHSNAHMRAEHVEYFEKYMPRLVDALVSCAPGHIAYVSGPCKSLGSKMPFPRPYVPGFDDMQNGLRFMRKLSNMSGRLGLLPIDPEREGRESFRQHLARAKRQNQLPWVVTVEQKADADYHDVNASRFAKAAQVDAILVVKHHPGLGIVHGDVPMRLAKHLPGVCVGVHYLRNEKLQDLLAAIERGSASWHPNDKVTVPGRDHNRSISA